MSKPSIVLYRGPSMLDGAPIVALASVGSRNVKTGSLIQTWIMRADLHPSEASQRKLDSSVCGQCPRRHSLGGDCYVQIFQAPRSVWQSWINAGSPAENWRERGPMRRLQADARAYGLRLGSYGDPAAVPWHVWQDLISALQPSKVVGYTHQWRVNRHTADWQWFRDNIMASCDTNDDALEAQMLGWRYFLAMPHGAWVHPRLKMVQCPATRERNPLNCYQCGICDGAQGRPSRASVYLAEHGMRSQSKAKRAAGLQVIQ